MAATKALLRYVTYCRGGGYIILRVIRNITPKIGDNDDTIGLEMEILKLVLKFAFPPESSHLGTILPN